MQFAAFDWLPWQLNAKRQKKKTKQYQQKALINDDKNSILSMFAVTTESPMVAAILK